MMHGELQLCRTNGETCIARTKQLDGITAFTHRYHFFERSYLLTAPSLRRINMQISARIRRVLKRNQKFSKLFW
jgi:hypothetical protein